jgi:hypothetical protein
MSNPCQAGGPRERPIDMQPLQKVMILPTAVNPALSSHGWKERIGALANPELEDCPSPTLTEAE